jgi:hypothetical protein
VHAVASGRTQNRQTCEYSYLLRVVVGNACSRRYVVQDLRSGERRDFDSEEGLLRFLCDERPRQLR